MKNSDWEECPVRGFEDWKTKCQFCHATLPVADKSELEELQAENARLREALDLVVGAYNWDTPMKAQQVMRQIAREALEEVEE